MVLDLLGKSILVEEFSDVRDVKAIFELKFKEIIFFGNVSFQKQKCWEIGDLIFVNYFFMPVRNMGELNQKIH